MTLHTAARRGDLRALQAALDAGEDIDVRKSAQARSALHLAARAGHTAAVQLLLRHGAATDLQDGKGHTALHLAVQEDQTAVIRALLHAGADPEIGNHTGTHPFYRAAATGDLELLGLLSEYPHPSGGERRSLLHAAAYFGQLGSLRLVLEQGGDINAQNDDQETPLHTAVSRRQDAIVRHLVENGADVNALDRFGRPPFGILPERASDEIRALLFAGLQPCVGLLHVAIKHNNARLAEWCLRGGVDPQAPSRLSLYKYPLHEACYVGRPRIARFLLQHGADPNQLDDTGSPPLHRAIKSDNKAARPQLVEQLMVHGAALKQTNRLQTTPMGMAVIYKRTRLVDILLNHGADIHAPASEEQTPILLASNPKMVKLLIRRGAVAPYLRGERTGLLRWYIQKDDPQLLAMIAKAGFSLEKRNAEGRTPWLEASASGCVRTLRWLAAQGVAQDVRDHAGKDALALSQENGHRHTLAFLQEHSGG